MEHTDLAGPLSRHHDNPFDRLLIAQTMIKGLILVTVDTLLEKYAVGFL